MATEKVVTLIPFGAPIGRCCVHEGFNSLHLSGSIEVHTSDAMFGYLSQDPVEFSGLGDSGGDRQTNCVCIILETCSKIPSDSIDVSFRRDLSSK